MVLLTPGGGALAANEASAAGDWPLWVINLLARESLEEFSEDARAKVVRIEISVPGTELIAAGRPRRGAIWLGNDIFRLQAAILPPGTPGTGG